MIKRLRVSNYKSIKQLDIRTKRVNVFIGEHNSGKSNILEALSWFSVNALDKGIFSEVFRYKAATDFFYDFDATKPISVSTDDFSLIIRYARNGHGSILDYLEGLIYKSSTQEDPHKIVDWNSLTRTSGKDFLSFRLMFDGTIDGASGFIESSFRTYVFKRLKEFKGNFRPFLNPPFGENIPSLLISNKSYQERVRTIFSGKGFRLMIKPTENDFSMAKDVNDELYSYPYPAISETLQRIVFYSLAIETNKGATIVLDEPESNTFPMYTKQLAEMIALDSNNQYFIATHNPYLLDSLVSKTPKKDLAVFLTTMKGYQTIAIEISNANLSKLLDKGVDFYFNLDKLVKN
jgi:AAA15 family ATPase/GTPase